MTMDFGGSRDPSDTMAESSIKALTAVHSQLRTLYTAEAARTEALGVAPTVTGFLTGATPTSAEVWVKVGATPMIGQNDVVGEIFTLDDARALNEFALEKRLGRMSMWSLGRDATCGPNYADQTIVSGQCSGVEQGDEFFSQTLADNFSSIPVPSTESTDNHEGDVAVPGEPDAQIVDDPATSPYEIWAIDSVFQKATKVVWHGNVYESKTWTKGDLPDDPSLSASETVWSLIGPVLPGDKPMVPIALPSGTYPEWSADTVYRSADRVLLDGVPYEAKWWTQTDRPDDTAEAAEDGAWRILTAAEVTAALAG
jgi:chitinase